MKITVDKSIPNLTDEDIKEMRENKNIRNVEDHPEEAKADLLHAKEVVLSPQILKQLEEMGMTPDELVAMLLKSVGASQ